MKQEIEKILKDEQSKGYDWIIDIDVATVELQKLFLSKQIELLEDLFSVSADLTDIWEKKERLESELKSLE